MSEKLCLNFFPAILLGLMACSHSEFSTHASIDLAHVYSLDTPFEVNEHSPRNQFSLLIYYPHLACNSCVNETLIHVVDLSKSFHNMDYLLVSGETGYDLDNLKRVRQINFPIIVERIPGEAGISGSSLCLFLVDAQTGKAIYRFAPRPGEKDLKYKEFLDQAVYYVEAHSEKR